MVLIAIALASWLGSQTAGFRFPYNNNVFHVPIVLDYFNSVEGPHDLFHASLDRFTSYFWPALGLLATESNVEALFHWLYWFVAVATCASIYGIVRATGAGRVAAIGVGLLPFMPGLHGLLPFGGGDLLYNGSLSHTQAATAMLLGGIALTIRGHWFVAAAICGLAANINLFMAVWTMAAMVGVRMVSAWPQWRRAVWPVARMSLTWALCAAPIFWWVIGDLLQSSAYEKFSFTRYLFEYFKEFPLHHLATIQPGALMMFLGPVLAVAVACTAYATNAAHRRLSSWLSVSTAVLIVGMITPYVTNEAMVLNLHPLRFGALLHWLVIAGVIAIWATFDERDRQRKGLATAAILGLFTMPPGLTVLALAALAATSEIPARFKILMATALGLLFAGSAFGLADIAYDSSLEQQLNLVFACVAFLAVLQLSGNIVSVRAAAEWALLAAATVLCCGDLPLSTAAAVLLSAATWIAAVSLLSGNARLRRWGCALPLVAALAVAIWDLRSQQADQLLAMVLVSVALSTTVLQVTSRGFTAGVPMAAILIAAVMLQGALGWRNGLSVGFAAYNSESSTDFREVQQWARDNTPADTLFHAPEDDGFSALSRRPVWWSWKEGAAVMWEPAFYAQWSERRIKAERQKSLSDWVDLARGENIAYLVLQRSSPLLVGASPRVAYQNHSYVVVDVRQ